MAAKTWWYALPLSLAAACGADGGGPEGTISAAPKAPEAAAGDAVDHAGLRAAWVAAVQKNAGPGYRLASAEKGGLSALNRAQGFSAELSSRGVRVATDARPDRVLDMTLESVGCDGLPEAVSPAEPEAIGNRAEYRRGAVVEWYENGPLGLEQGFDIAEPPACRKDGGKDVTIALRLEGLSAELTANADAALLRDEKGEVILRYTDLRVTDANGRVLPAKLEAGDSSISIHVDDTNAAYPIVVDPIVWSETQKVVSADPQLDDAFGTSVAIDADTAVVGAPSDDEKGTDAGAAYVFLRSAATNLWSFSQKLMSNDASGTAGDRFGASVAVSGNNLVVGAPNDNANRGAVFSFQRTAFGVNFGVANTQKLTAGGVLAAGDQFGKSVAISGNTFVGGAPYRDTNGTDSGAAFVYFKGGTTFAIQATILAGAAGAAGDELGTSVGISADTIVVGAYGDDDNGSVSGSAYVFLRSGVTWTQQAKLAPPDGKANDWFGYAVAIDGNTALMGAPFALNATGKVYAYLRTGAAWAQQGTLLAADGDGGDQFGYAVSVSGNTAVIGARYDEPSTTGSAYVFERPVSTWSQTKKITGSDAGAADQYGIGVGVSGSWVIVGDPGQDGAASNAGAAYLYTPLNKLDDGQACMAGSDCVSNFCVDGVCCDTACGGGAAGDCQACNVAGMVGMCMPLAMGTQCRGAAGMCDKAEVCDGAAVACPPDDKQMAGTECHASAGACDPAEVCDGLGNDCPADALAMAGTECRASAGACDTAEACDGANVNCPADAVVAAGTECRTAAGACDTAEACDGVMAACPSDAKIAAGTECRASAGDCDAAEACDGSNNDCPADAKMAAGSLCRGPAGQCDAAETCDGTTDNCPADAFVAANTECRAAKDACDLAEACDGATVDCPTDTFAADGTTCDNGTCQTGICEANGTGGAGGNGTGGNGTGGSGATGGNGETGGSNPTGGTEPTVEGGCGCRVAGTDEDKPTSKALLGLALGLAAFARRRRAR